MTVHYKQEDGAVIPLRVHTVVISVQHDDNILLEEQKRILREKVIKAVVPAKYLDDKTTYHLQPSGRFVIGGPQVSFNKSFCNFGNKQFWRNILSWFTHPFIPAKLFYQCLSKFYYKPDVTVTKHMYCFPGFQKPKYLLVQKS